MPSQRTILDYLDLDSSQPISQITQRTNNQRANNQVYGTNLKSILEGSDFIVVFISGLLAGSRLSPNYKTMQNLGQLLKEINPDRVIISGALMYVPKNNSPTDRQYLDLMERDLRRVFPDEEVYRQMYETLKKVEIARRSCNISDNQFNFLCKAIDQVNGKRRSKPSRDYLLGLLDAAVVARFLLKPIVESGMSITYVYSREDYGNVKNLIDLLDGFTANPNSSVTNKALMLYGIDWKNAQKTGAVQVANKAYVSQLKTIFGEKAYIGKRFFEEIVINGKDGKSYILLTMPELSVDRYKTIPSPYKYPDKWAVQRAKELSKERYFDGLFIFGEGPFAYTALNLDRIVDIAILPNLFTYEEYVDAKKRWNRSHYTSWNGYDSGVVIFAKKGNKRIIVHISYNDLKNSSGASLDKYALVADAHVGSQAEIPISAEDFLYSVLRDIESRGIDKIAFLGDMVQGGTDKVYIQKPLISPETVREEIKSIIDQAETGSISKEEARKKVSSLLFSYMYGNGMPQVTDQITALFSILFGFVKKYPNISIAAVGGNHYSKATKPYEENEAMLFSLLKNAGINVKIVEQSLGSRIWNISNKTIYLIHSVGYRGGAGAALSPLYYLIKTGRMDVDAILSGDAHEVGVASMYFPARGKAIIAARAATGQQYTDFESDVIQKTRPIRSYSILYLSPTSSDNGTFAYELIPIEEIISDGSLYYRAMKILS